MTEEPPKRYRDIAPQQFKCIIGAPWLWHRKASALKGAASVLWADYEQHAAARSAILAGGVTSKPPAQRTEKGTRNAETLMSKLDMGDVALMLAGMALENMAKAVLAKQGKLELNGSKLKSKVATHKLRKHFKDADITLNQEQARTLDLLEKYVQWRGRYHAPIGSDDMVRENEQGMKWQRENDADPDLWQEFLTLFALAEKRLKE